LWQVECQFHTLNSAILIDAFYGGVLTPCDQFKLCDKKKANLISKLEGE